MRPLTVHFGDVHFSLRGAMLFPDSPDLAKAYSAGALSTIFRPAIADGHAIPIELIAEVAECIALSELRPSDVARRQYWGEAVGQVVKILWAMTNSERAQGHGWSAAIKIVGHTLEAQSENYPYSRKTIYEWLAVFGPAMHLWGLQALRDDSHAFNNTPDPSDPIGNFGLFFAEAEEMLNGLRSWRDARNKAKWEEDPLLTVEEIGPCDGLTSSRLFLSPLVPKVRLTDEQFALLKRSGRPVKNLSPA
jgi:hypothetical protein